MIDHSRDEIPVDFAAEVLVSVQRFIWIFDIEVLGGNYVMDFLIPIAHKDIRMGALHYDDRRWSIGDIFVEPFAITWHGPKYDSGIALGVFMPTGAYDEPVDSGEDMWTAMLSLGGTYYLDQAKQWSVSILSRYEVHSKKSHSSIHPGDDFHFEWGIGRQIARIWDIGVVGYCQWQVEQDRGHDASNEKDSSYGIGPEISRFFPPLNTLFSLRYEYDFHVKGRTSGRPAFNRAFLVIAKRW